MAAGPLLLALTTATDACGVALWRDGRVQAHLALHRPRRHAEQLVPLVQSVLSHAGAETAALDAVALTAGPGSYTGLRIGASTAKGLCMASGARLVAVSTLAALAEAASSYAPPGALLCPVLRSRRGEVYAAAFRSRPEQPSRLFDDEALATDAAAQRFLEARAAAEGETTWLLGSGAERVSEALSEEVRARFRQVGAARVEARAAARLGARRLASGTVEDVAAFEPRYLKAFHATPRRRSVFEDAS